MELTMALTYEELGALMTNIQFKDRVKVACLNFANTIAGEAPGVTAHNTRYKWAQSAFLNPEGTAQGIQYLVCQDDNVKAEGSAITDVDLQTATEYAVQKII
jgi:hypothetical protein